MKINRHIRNLRAYPLASHKAWEEENKEDVLKLDWNEAVLKLPESVIAPVRKFLEDGPTSWYPDIANRELVREIAAFVGVPENSVQYFEGSDCGLDYLIRTVVEPGDEVVLAAPTYDNFRVYVESAGAVPVQAIAPDPLTKSLDTLMNAITGKTAMLYIANPNNPTGVAYSKEEIETIAKAFPELFIVIDEAYAEFARSSLAGMAAEHPTVIVSRSFSKAFGLASFRIGYLVAHPELLESVNKIRNGKNISAFAQLAAIAALKNRDYMHAYVADVEQAQAELAERLGALGFSVITTPANFILVRTSDPKRFRDALAERKVFVRGLDHLSGMDGLVRVSVGHPEAMRRFADILAELVKEGAIVP